MSNLRVGIVGFDITPRIHPRFGAWGTTPSMTEIDMPLLARCLALEHTDLRLVWFGLDLVGDLVPGTDQIRDEVAAALGLERWQVIWSTSQTHSSGALPGSIITGSSVTEVADGDAEFAQQERRRFIDACQDAARQALDQLQPCQVFAGHGFCDSMSYNRRLPMPGGGVKFSRHHGEGLQSGKFFDPTIGLVRFEDLQGKPLGAIFNFGAHPATMIAGRMVSPDWVGTARRHVEDAMDGAPAMFVQGFCGDVVCYHIFGTPEQAKQSGERLGRAAAKAMNWLIPVRTEPLVAEFRTVELPCRAMYSRDEVRMALERRHAFIDELEQDPTATWFDGINLPDQFPPAKKAAAARQQIEYLEQVLRMIDAGGQAPSSLQITLGALRIGDVAAVLAPGENFTATGLKVRQRSPFVHTLICGDTNGLVGYFGDDAEIDRGGYETDGGWKMLHAGQVRLAPGKGSVGLIVDTLVELLTTVR